MTLKYVASEQETDCLLHMLGVGNVLSTTNLLVFLISPLKSSVVIESNTNRNICSMENTKIKVRRPCKMLFTKKQAKEKRSWSVRRSPIHSLCVSHGYEPTPRLFRTRIALLCENDVALASPIGLEIGLLTKITFRLFSKFLLKGIF